MTAARHASPTTRRICWWSTTTAASAICCRAFCRRGLSRHHRRHRGGRARQARRPELRSAHPRRDDAGRNRLRSRQVDPRHLERADPDADRARRRRKPHHGPRDRRRRLCRQAVRAARTVAAHRQHPQARASRPPRRRSESVRFGPFVFHLGARRIAPRRGDHPPHRPRARDAARAGRRRRAKPCRAWRSPATAARSASARSTCRSTGCAARSSAIPPIRCSCRPCAASATGWWSHMTSLDIGTACAPRSIGSRAWQWYEDPPVRAFTRARQIADGWRRFSRWLNGVMPKGLYARALLIIIAPMVILQSVVAFVFMERHWNLVTQQLSAGGGAGHRGADRRLSRLSAGRRPRADPPHRAGAARPGGRFPAARPTCRRRGRSRSSRCSTRRCRWNCASRSAGRSGSTPSAARRWSKSASSSTTR